MTRRIVSYRLIGPVGLIEIDNPPVNALSHEVRAGLLDAITRAQTDASKALLLACAGRSFIAGADITEFDKPPEPPLLPDLLNAIEASAKIVIAAIHGTALGGGFETALACHYRIALESARVGFPEVRLGLIPGAGGTQRAPRLAGIPAAAEMMASGKPVEVETAAGSGLIDRVVTGDLREQALAWARELAVAGAPLRRVRDLEIGPVDESVFAGIEARIARQARGQLAPLKIVECLRAACSKPFDEGLAVERAVFTSLEDGPQSRALRHVFFAERAAGKVAGLPPETAGRELARVGVVGGGTMGTGIAMSFATAGLPAVLVEIDDETLAQALETIDRNYAGSVERGKLDAAAAADCRKRVTGSTSFGDLADCDLVIEAVFEDPVLKKRVFGELDAICRPGAILATNTSYQDVDAIAAATSRPADVLGLHFFSPAHVMKLLEVVRGEQTADDVLATAMRLAKRIGKVPVLAGVCYGFIGNRMLAPYLREAQLCLLEGSSPEAVDSAMEAWGMAMGPISVADLAGLDVGYRARQALPADLRGDPRPDRVADALVEAGRLGRKTGAGFYRYETGRRLPDPEVEALIRKEAGALGLEQRDITADEIVGRLTHALINEGMRILDERIAQRPGDIDIVYIHGYGFPAWRGGPMFHADALGLRTVLEHIREFRERFGETWEPAPLLERLVSEERTLGDWKA